MDIEDKEHILTSWRAKPNTQTQNNRIDATLFVLKRKLIDQIFEAVDASKQKLAAITVDHDSEPFNILPNLNHPKLLRQRRIKSSLILAFIALMAIGFFVTTNHIDNRQQMALNDLDSLIIQVSAKAKVARRKIDERNLIYNELSDLRNAKGNQPSMHAMLERITTALPLHSWITEFRLNRNDLVSGNYWPVW